MNSTIASNGGSPGEQLFKWSALGGDKLPAGDLGALWDFKKRMSLGVGDSENVRGMMNKAMSFGGGADGALTKFTLAAQFKMTETETESLIDSIEKEMASYIDRQKKKGKTVTREDIYGSPEMYHEVFTSSRAAGGLEGDAGRGTDEHTRVQAGIEELQVKLGDAMLSVADPIKKGLTDVANTINRGDFVKAVAKMTNLMLGDPAGEYSDTGKMKRYVKDLPGGETAISIAEGVRGFVGGIADKASSRWMVASDVKTKKHGEMVEYLKAYQNQEMDFEEMTRYKAYRDHLKTEDPEKLKGVITMNDQQVERLFNILEARINVSSH
jgi:hypothetical protein